MLDDGSSNLEPGSSILDPKYLVLREERGKVMPNRLIKEKSPYLLQHAQNPVDWYPWGEEAFARAKREEKPIFLSIGYATCHWCHVMAHESFEDEEVAQKLNQSFVAVKVDREERPDVDQVYMTVCQALTGRGGWPLSVFLTPEGKPFFAGTYFPKTRRLGMSGFLELLTEISSLWERDRGRILKAADQVTMAIRERRSSTPSHPVSLEDAALEGGVRQLQRAFDPSNGGFGSAPKFPTPHHLTFLLRQYRRKKDRLTKEIVEKTLTAMRFGGIYDHLGWGFHRYATDEKWRIPHFEKMLYDQALSALAYLEAFQCLKDPFYGRTAREIFEYVLRDMTDREGGFYSAEDADSEGKEGTYYLWTPKEIAEVLGDEEGDLFCRFYGITEEGNFEEGKSIPYQTTSKEAFAARVGMGKEVFTAFLEKARDRLLAFRRKRIPPLKDDKVLTAWNGLMIAALAKGAQVFGEDRYARAAEKAAAFVLEKLTAPDGGLYRRWRQDEAAHTGYLEDYAFLIWGLLDLYEAVFDPFWLEKALELNDRLSDRFWDEEQGGCFFTPRGAEELILREKDLYDGAVPSGNSVAALNFLRLARMTGRTDLEENADRLVRFFSAAVAEQPMAYTQFLYALDFMVGPAQEIVAAGDPADPLTQEMIAEVHRAFLPNKVLLFLPDEGEERDRLLKAAPFLESFRSLNGRPTIYLCSRFTCRSPITEVKELKRVLDESA